MPRDEAAEVLVIGAGAAGAAFAWRLSEAGIKVVCLEQGKWVDPADHPTKVDKWELRHRRPEFHPYPNVRRLPEDYPVNDTESALAPLMFNAVGGSTILWGGHFPRFHPSDFRVKTLDSVADDWPIRYQDLELYYDLNDAHMGVIGLAGDPANPPRMPRKALPQPLGLLGQRVAQGFEKLGWHWWPSDNAILTPQYDGRSPTDIAISSTDVTYWPKAIANGAVLLTQCTVREITMGKNGLADGVLYYNAKGNLQRLDAKLVVLACNGIGTPRLLLNSKSPFFPEGLANHNGLVGKNLMYHLTAFVAAHFDDIFEPHWGPSGSTMYSQQFYETDAGRGFVRGFQLQVIRGAGPGAIAQGGIGGHRVSWGPDHHIILNQRFGHAIGASVTCEDLPEPHNSVTLDPALTDSHGIPAPKVNYKVSENSQRILAFGIARAREAFEAANAREVLANPLVRYTGFHLMGTTRMGTDPETSVVDEWGRAHSVKNLFVVDSSVFVTCAALNPVPTIQALALRSADYIRANARNLPG
ncbi:MAG: GMC family oxidoreductase [Chloroflexi bacterium]|nr:GMC family oxidoreductase [Chloroflexota bacterium]